MPKISVPDEREQKIITENGMDPNEYGVIHGESDCLRLLCYRTRDQIVIRKGDRAWS